MEPNLLQEFLSEDCSAGVKTKLLAAIEELSSGGDRVRDFSFNRFNVRLTAAVQEVLIEDILNPSESGECRVGFNQFKEALR